MKQLLVGIISFMTIGATAQIEIGGALAFGTEISSLGLQARGQYGINDQFDGTFNLTYFFPDKESFGSYESKVSLFTLNFDGHYNAYSTETIEVYPLLGLNISIVSVKVEGDFLGQSTSAKDSETKIGLNIGGGTSYAINEGLNAFGEIKYVASDFDQLVITLGVLKAI